jgi:hypothetical protein
MASGIWHPPPERAKRFPSLHTRKAASQTNEGSAENVASRGEPLRASESQSGTGPCGRRGHQIAAPAELKLATKLPKTRSGKIMRRVLKAQGLGLDPGDGSKIEE